MSLDKTSCDQKWGSTIYAHSGEDIIILNLFDQLKIKYPTYIDIGAHSPTTISNTHLMYMHGSRGVNVEANPNLISNFHRERPEDINLNYGVIPPTLNNFKDLEFYMIDDWSGRNSFSLEAANSVERETKGVFKVTKTITVPVKTLNQIIDEYCGGVFPEFMNIDIEGLDYDVLATANFNNSMPMIVCSESLDENVPKMILMMQAKGFRSIFRIGMNNIYLSEEALYQLYRV